MGSMHLYDQSFIKLKNSWEPRLKDLGIQSVPTDPDAFAELIFARPEYLDRKNRDSNPK